MLAVAALCTNAQSTPPQSSDEDPVFAVVNGHEVRLSEVYRRIEALPLGEQIGARQRLDRFAASVVQEEIMLQSMLASDFAGEEALRDRIKSEIAAYLIETYVEQKAQVTDEEVRRFYDENPGNVRNDHVGVSQIVLGTRAECERMMAEIDSRDAFAEAARSHSLDKETASKGGEIGYFMDHAGPYGFEQALFDMTPGEMAIFDRDDGCHLVRVTERVTPPMPPFENVEPSIREFLEGERRGRLLRELVERSAQGIEVEAARK